MGERRADAVQPRPLVTLARRRERRAAQLFRVEAVGASLRRIAPERQCAGESLGFESIAETRHVSRPNGALICGISAGKRVWILDVHVCFSLFASPERLHA